MKNRQLHEPDCVPCGPLTVMQAMVGRLRRMDKNNLLCAAEMCIFIA